MVNVRGCAWGVGYHAVVCEKQMRVGGLRRGVSKSRGDEMSAI